MLTIQIFPKEKKTNLIKEFKDKLKSMRVSSFFSAGRNKWRHRKYYGWVSFYKNCSGCYAKIQSRNVDYELFITRAFIGWVLRHFKNKISTINIQVW